MRPIDADALKFKPCVLSDEVGFSICSAIKKSEIDAAPTLDYAPVEHGNWGAAEIIGYDGIHAVYGAPCSECGAFSREYYRLFCSNCGAKMDGGTSQ